MITLIAIFNLQIWNNNSYLSKYQETEKIEVHHLRDNYNARNSHIIFVEVGTLYGISEGREFATMGAIFYSFLHFQYSAIGRYS